MNNYPNYVKNKLKSIIKEMGESAEIFVKNPKRDFTRNRKLNFENVMNLLISMGGNSIYTELLEYFKYNVETATSSAFIQQRDKILPSAFEFLLDKFTSSFKNNNTYHRYRLLAVDGLIINIAYNLKDIDIYL